MKKSLVFITTLALLLACTAAYISAQHDIISEVGDNNGGGVGNTATCYSTYTEPVLGVGGTKIWVCGSCVQAKAKTFSDAGTCFF
jgi:hypothetical protein